MTVWNHRQSDGLFYRIRAIPCRGTEQNCVTGAGKLDVSDTHKMPGKTSDFDFGSFFVQNGAILRQKGIELTGFGYSQKAGLDI